jgi:hypothetical protein
MVFWGFSDMRSYNFPYIFRYYIAAAMGAEVQLHIVVPIALPPYRSLRYSLVPLREGIGRLFSH